MSNTNFPTGLQSENSASRTMDVCQSGIPRRILLRSRDCTKKNLEKYRNTGWGPKDSFQLRCGCEKTMVFGRYNEPVNGVYKPTYHWGGPCTLKYHFCSVQFLYPRKICRLRELKLLRILEAYIHGIPGLKMFMDFFHWKAMTLGWNMMESLRGLC